MNADDMIRLEELNRRYSSVNMTGFRIITKKTTKRTVLDHITTDLEILNTSDVENKRVYRVLLESDVIDICSNDNGTPVSYFFTSEAQFRPKDIKDELKKLCTNLKIRFEDLRNLR